MTFSDLAPGETRTKVEAVTLERDSTIEAAEWEERTGLLADSPLGMTACRGEACVDAATFVATAMTAGTIEVRVTVTVADDAPPAASGTALGRLTFVAADDELASTGVGFSPWVIGGGVLVIIGILLALTARGRPARGAP
ncbi:hypothetical protein WJX64_05235 [Leifsonia sp. YIM 134122]|uniref:Uncharacterized protein n=1 Tax=Leifsonia stereocauli TaxID=3134136 RepID=A0ABU9W1R3_9MICO